MKELNDYQYYILPGKCPVNFEYTELHNQAYTYWRDFWDKFFNVDEVASTKSNRHDDFLRQDVVAVIMYKKQIVAMHLYTFFNIKTVSALEHSYFSRSYDAQFIEKLEKCGVESTMSFEWLTVDPAFRKSKTNFSFSLVTIALGGMIQKALSIDAAIAVSRSDVKVTQSAVELGFDVIIPDVSMHGYPCDLIAWFLGKAKDHPIEDVNRVCRQLWEGRIDLTGLTKQNNQPIRHLRVA